MKLQQCPVIFSFQACPDPDASRFCSCRALGCSLWFQSLPVMMNSSLFPSCFHSGHSLLHIFVRHLCFRSVEGGGGGGGGGGGLNQVTDPGGRFFCQLQVSCGRLTGIFNYIYWWVQWGHSIHSYVSVILLQIHFHSQGDYIKGGLLN